jgi:DNA polymerase-3 subunit beta
MKIAFDRGQMLAAFQLAASVAPSRTTKEILHNVKLEVTGEQVALLATDLDLGVRVPVNGVELATAGKALLPVARMLAILRESNDDALELSLGESGLSIIGTNSRFQLPSANPDEFPTIPQFEQSDYCEVAGRLMREMIKRTVFATDADSSRYALGGVLLEMTDETITAVGTDGRRLASMAGPAKRHADQEDDQLLSAIIPTRSLALIERAIGDGEQLIQVAVRSNDVTVRTERAVIYSRLVEGRYPNWRQVIPNRTESVKVACTVGPFYAALRQAAIVTDQESRGVDFQFGDGSLVLAARTAEVGESRIELPIPYTGPTIALTMDHRFVGDFVRVLELDTVFDIEISTSSDPAVFRTSDGYQYVVMPMARER